MKIQISLSLERNNLSKKAKIFQVDEMMLTLVKDKDCLAEYFIELCPLQHPYTAWIDKSWGMIAILDGSRKPVGGVYYESIGNHTSTQSIKLLPEAQGKGLIQGLIEYIIKLQGGIYSSSSISPGAALTFKKLADKYGGYIAWPDSAAKSYTPISSWKPRGIYKAFPFVRAPDGAEYPVDELEESIGRSNSPALRKRTQWKFGEIWIGKNGQPPPGFKQLSLAHARI